MYGLQSLQGRSFGSQIFMAELKTSKDSAFFKSAETNPQILDRRESKEFAPLYTPLIGLAKKSSYVLCYNNKDIWGYLFAVSKFFCSQDLCIFETF